jgi:hypothetical protein
MHIFFLVSYLFLYYERFSIKIRFVINNAFVNIHVLNFPGLISRWWVVAKSSAG